MAKVQSRVEGINELKVILASMTPRIKAIVAHEVSNVTTAIATESRGLVPEKERMLSGSQVVTKVPNPRGATGWVEYGGTAAPYALVQHEGIDPRTGKLYFHPANADGGTGPGTVGESRSREYLAEPAKRHQKTFPTLLLAAIKAGT